LLPARLALWNEISGGREFSRPIAFTPSCSDRCTPPATPRRIVKWQRLFNPRFGA
jgi:hypothetical protein